MARGGVGGRGLRGGPGGMDSQSGLSPFTIEDSAPGGSVSLTVSNTSNTAASTSLIVSQVAGTSAGDPKFQSKVIGGKLATFGVDNDYVVDNFRIAINASGDLSDPIATFGAGGTELRISIAVRNYNAGIAPFTLQTYGAGYPVMNFVATNGDTFNIAPDPNNSNRISFNTDANLTLASELFYMERSGHFTNLTGFNQASVTTGIVASTNQTQGQGALTREINVVATCANANDTVTLPAAVAGRTCVVINNGAQVLQIFPASGDNLGAGVDTATTLAAGSNRRFVAYDSTNWEVV